jgi:hypothetical protein
LRKLTRALAIVLALCAAACASPGTPPGGPVDTQAPQIVRITPDSARTSVRPSDVVFRFDEVVNERPSGAPSLNALFLISPRDGEPRVNWNRTSIAVRPRRGWKANTAYTVTLLPGLSDLRGNIRNTGAVTIFSTGATIPAGRIAGTLFNWPEGKVIPRGVVQAFPPADTTLVYVTTTDSAGAFTLSNLAPGSYVVRGFSDDNSNRSIDQREAWDTSAVNVSDSVRTELLAFVHDSVGARLLAVSLRDSVTVELLFDNPLSADVPITPGDIRIRAPDSTDVPIASLVPPEPDTTTSVRKPGRPVPAKSVLVRLARPLRPKTDYRVIVTNARNLIGISRSSERTLAVPAPPPPVSQPSTAAPPAPVRR